MNNDEQTIPVPVHDAPVPRTEAARNALRIGLACCAGFVAVNVAVAVYHRVTPSDRLTNVDISPKEFRLGDVAQGRLVSATVMLTNRNAAPLRVTRATPGCGCTVVKAPAVLLPGKPTPISVTYDTAGATGAVHKGLTVQFTQSPEPLTLSITGNIREEIRLSSAEQTLGTVNGGDRKAFVFTATRLDGKPFTVKPSDLPPIVCARVEQVATNTVRVTGTVTAPLLPDAYTDALSFTTDDAALPRIETRLSYTVRPRFIMEPPRANFGAIAPNAKPELLVSIRGVAPVRIVSVPRGVHARLTKHRSGNGAYQLAVSLAEQGKDTVLSERLILATDDPKQPQIIVPLYAATRR